MNARRVVHVSSVHAWNDTRIFIKMCRSLAASGWETHFVVPVLDAHEPFTVDGVTVHPVAPGRGRVRRMTRVARDVFARAAALDGDVYHFHDSEGLPHAAGWQKRLKRPFVYDAHEELRKQVLDKPWIPWLLRRPAALVSGICEDHWAARMSGIVAAHAAIGEQFAGHGHMAVVNNYPLLRELEPSPGRRLPEPGCFAYVGFLSQIRDPREMTGALRLLGGAARLRFAGRFMPESFAGACRMLPGWEYVDECGQLERAGVATLLAHSLAGLALFHPLANHVRARPNKIFEYMAAGLPVIASNFPDWRDIVEANGCGLQVDPRDPEAIAKAMRWILDHPDKAGEMGRKGRAVVEERYNWEREFPKLLDLYQSILEY